MDKVDKGCTYLTIGVDDEGESHVTVCAQSECEKGTADGRIDPMHSLLLLVIIRILRHIHLLGLQ